MATECFCLVVNDDSNGEEFNMKKLCNLGEYMIEWRRRSPYNTDTDNDSDSDSDSESANAESELANDLFYTLTEVKMPEISIEPFPFLIETSLSSHGTLEKQLTIVYTIINKTRYSMLDIECTLEENDQFSIGGNKLVSSYFFVIVMCIIWVYVYYVFFRV